MFGDLLLKPWQVPLEEGGLLRRPKVLLASEPDHSKTRFHEGLGFRRPVANTPVTGEGDPADLGDDGDPNGVEGSERQLRHERMSGVNDIVS